MPEPTMIKKRYALRKGDNVVTRKTDYLGVVTSGVVVQVRHPHSYPNRYITVERADGSRFQCAPKHLVLVEE